MSKFTESSDLFERIDLDHGQDGGKHIEDEFRNLQDRFKNPKKGERQSRLILTTPSTTDVISPHVPLSQSIPLISPILIGFTDIYISFDYDDI